MPKTDNWNQHWTDYDEAARANPAQAYRRELILDWLYDQPGVANSRILDVGSGQGDLVAELVHIFPLALVKGVELSETGIYKSRIKAPDAQFFQRDLVLLPEGDDPLRNWAQLAVCCEVLEHLDYPDLFLKHASQLLAPGARLMITVPGGPISAFDRHIGHRRHFSVDRLRQLVQKAGMVPERVFGTGFPFFNLYRVVVILRGKSLVNDVGRAKSQQLSYLARLVMFGFSLVLKKKMNITPRGWQMIAIARRS